MASDAGEIFRYLFFSDEFGYGLNFTQILHKHTHEGYEIHAHLRKKKKKLKNSHAIFTPSPFSS